MNLDQGYMYAKQLQRELKDRDERGALVNHINALSSEDQQEKPAQRQMNPQSEAPKNGWIPSFLKRFAV